MFWVSFEVADLPGRRVDFDAAAPGYSNSGIAMAPGAMILRLLRGLLPPLRFNR